MTDQLTEQQLDDQAVQILSNEGAQCGSCGDQPGDRVCPDCEKVRAGYVAALRAAGWTPQVERPTSGPRVEQLEAILSEVLGTFGPMHDVYGGPVSYYDGSADIEVEQFEKWRGVLNGEAIIRASKIELDGGDVMLQEMSVGDPIEIDKQTGPLRPGCWVITAFEADDRSSARVRRLATEEIQAARRGEAFAHTTP